MGLNATLVDSRRGRLHPELVKARIRIAHGSVAAFEKANDLPARSVRDVLRGRPNRRVVEALARFLGVKPARLNFGGPINTHSTSPKGDSHRLNKRAA